jgi:MoaA/NifB/PqqE/SkfB family radical SAM enzyme
MHFEQIIDELTREYDIQLMDLSDFFINDDKWLYDVIENVYKEVYDNDHRLVFYFTNDQYLYNDGRGTLISLLQGYIALFDISHFFIKIITEDKMVIPSLKYSHQQFAIDDYPIECIIATNIAGYVVPKNSNDPMETICASLWDEFYIDPSAEVFPCCNIDKRNVFVDMDKGSYMEISNSENFRKLRIKMLNGQKDRNCALCYEIEKSNTFSLRMKANKPYENMDIVDILRNKTDDNGKISLSPTRLVFGFKNTCNLKCVMCTGSSSSAIQKEEIVMFGKTFQPRDKLLPVDYKKRMDMLLPIVENLEHIIFSAGEPLLIKEHYEILDRLVALERWDINIEYYTNLTMMTYHNRDIIDCWRKFNNLNLNFSLDAMHDQGEYVRNGIEWDLIMDNYDNIKCMLPTTNVEIHSTMHLYNAFRVIPFHKEWITKNLIDPSKLRVRAVVFPDVISLQVLPVAYKETLAIEIKEHIRFLSSYPNTEYIIYLWECVYDYVWEANNSHLLHQFVDYTDKKDKHRELCFETTFPEYAGLRDHILNL